MAENVADGAMSGRSAHRSRTTGWPQRNVVQVVLLALLAGACAPVSPPSYGDGPQAAARDGATPAWLDGGPSVAYPDGRYLRAVGHGPNRVACENDARGALSKIFSAEISQRSTDWQEHFSRVNAMGAVQVEAMGVHQLTQVSTDYVLKGTRIVEVWHGPDAFHCLGVLDRISAGRALATEIDRRDAQIGAQLGEGDAAPTTTARFLHYKRALELFQQREAFDAELRIVNATGDGRPSPHGWEQLVAKFTGAKSGAKIGLRLSGRDANKVQACLAGQLAEKGIEVLEDTSDIDLMVHGDVKWYWAGRVLGSYMVRIDITLRITDVEQGRTLAAFNEGLQSGRPQKSMALQSASNKLCVTAAPKLAAQIEAALSAGP